eukprot:scaffold35187_cov32-Phaeocystis_antarctica.AAC.3
MDDLRRSRRDRHVAPACLGEFPCTSRPSERSGHLLPKGMSGRIGDSPQHRLPQIIPHPPLDRKRLGHMHSATLAHAVVDGHMGDILDGDAAR